MAAARDPHAVLGVDRSASDDEVRAAYRARSMLLHPDLHQGRPEPVRREAQRAMIQLTEAYEALRHGGHPDDGGGGRCTLAFRLGRTVGRALR